jgi:hypothetical protein
MNRFAFFLLFLFFNSQFLFSQETQLKETITSFFEVFHKKDVEKLKQLCHEDVKLMSIMHSNKGTEIKNETAEQFYTGIQSIPYTTNFEEKTFEYTIHFDEVFAQVWVPYEFYVNGKLTHRGNNSFQLMKKDNQWVIISITDSRIR